VDYAAVASAGEHAQPGQCFEQEDIVPAASQRTSDGTTHDASADDDHVCAIHR